MWHSYTVGNRTLDQLYPSLGTYNTPVGGLAWYRKEVNLGDAYAAVGLLAGALPQHSLYLRVGGVHRSVTAYANGVLLGQHTGYLDALEWDVTAAAARGHGGPLLVVLAVDSFHNMSTDPLMGCFDMGEEPELNNPLPADPPVPGLSGPWGGIWGHVTLETRAPMYLGDLFAHAANATVVAIELGRVVALYCHLSTSSHIH